MYNAIPRIHLSLKAFTEFVTFVVLIISYWLDECKMGATNVDHYSKMKSGVEYEHLLERSQVNKENFLSRYVTMDES